MKQQYKDAFVIRSSTIPFLMAFVFSTWLMYNNMLLNSAAGMRDNKMLRALQASKNPQGPWPECSFMTGTECSDYIKSIVPSDVLVQTMDYDSLNNAVSNFSAKRVIVYVNHLDAVQQTPARG